MIPPWKPKPARPKMKPIPGWNAATTNPVSKMSAEVASSVHSAGRAITKRCRALMSGETAGRDHIESNTYLIQPCGQPRIEQLPNQSTFRGLVRSAHLQRRAAPPERAKAHAAQQLAHARCEVRRGQVEADEHQRPRRRRLHLVVERRRTREQHEQRRDEDRAVAREARLWAYRDIHRDIHRDGVARVARGSDLGDVSPRSRAITSAKSCGK